MEVHIQRAGPPCSHGRGLPAAGYSAVVYTHAVYSAPHKESRF